MSLSVDAIRRQVEEQSGFVARLREEIGRIVVGQQYMIDRLLVGVLANGHVLVEGVPGLAKTTAVKALATAIDCKFTRIQFTPDLLPADLIGTLVYNPKDGAFTTRKGPVFGNIILADEINRAPAKVQSALLEAMQERQVTIGDTTFPLDEPFMVLATQNPIEQEGTYPLPEAQVDRFMLKLKITYPSKVEEREIMDRGERASRDQGLSGGKQARDHRCARSGQSDLRRRQGQELHRGHRAGHAQSGRVSDWTSNTLSSTAPRRARPSTCSKRRAPLAFLQGEGNVFPNDVKQVAMDVLRHRVIVTYEAEAENLGSEDIIRKILETVPVP